MIHSPCVSCLSLLDDHEKDNKIGDSWKGKMAHLIGKFQLRYELLTENYFAKIMYHHPFHLLQISCSCLFFIKF
jgi:hypothetical protein